MKIHLIRKISFRARSREKFIKYGENSSHNLDEGLYIEENS